MIYKDPKGRGLEKPGLGLSELYLVLAFLAVLTPCLFSILNLSHGHKLL